MEISNLNILYLHTREAFQLLLSKDHRSTNDERGYPSKKYDTDLLPSICPLKPLWSK